MDYDEFLDSLLAEPVAPSVAPAASSAPATTAPKRARLAALDAGGQAKQFGVTYKGHAVTADLIDNLPDQDIEQLHARYESRLGAAMTKTLGSSAIRLYASLAATVFPIPSRNRAALITDLEEDPFLSMALGNACCELFYRYGTYLAPLTCALTTARHCEFGAEEQGAIPAQPANDGDATGRGTDAPADAPEEAERS